MSAVFTLEGRDNKAKKAMRLIYTEQPTVSQARWHSVLAVLRSQHLKIPASHLEHWSFSEQYTQVSFPHKFHSNHYCYTSTAFSQRK